MKFILLFLFIPLSFAGSPPSCGDLGKYLDGFEYELHKKSIADCKPNLYQDLIKDTEVVSKDFLKDKACQELSTIETQLEQAKLELAVLTGIEKLKLTVGESKEQTKDPNPVPARKAGMTFIASVNTAASLEVLLATYSTNNGKDDLLDPTSKDDVPFLKKLKEFPDNKRLSPKDLNDRIAELCKNKPKTEPDACNPNVFKPGKEAAEEILKLILTSEPNAQTIESWTRMLSIKKKGVDGEDSIYSFQQMEKEMSGAFAQLDKKEPMSKEHLRAIQSLNDFESAPGLSFVEDIASLKDPKKSKVASEQFFLLIGDAKLRQNFQAQSKFSAVWKDVSASIPDLAEAEKGQCSNAKNNFDDLKLCLAVLEKTLPKIADQLAKSKLTAFLDALRISVNYADKLDEKERLCRAEMKSKETLPEPCFTDFNTDLASVQDQILQLNIVKDKIGSQNMDLMAYRNFALQKWGSQKCQSIVSSIESCEDDAIISKELAMTVSDSMEIALLYSPAEDARKKAEEEAKAVCEAEGRKPNKIHDHICEFFNDTTSNIVEISAEKQHPDGPTVAPDGEHDKAALRDAYIGGAAQVLGAGLQYFMPKTTFNPYANPNMYNYTPFNASGPQTLGIADSIMFNARYHGAYGYYMPTTGFRPGTAFGGQAGVSSYTSVGSSAGKYFGF